MASRSDPRRSLRAFELPLIGAWIACIVMFWIAVQTHHLESRSPGDFDRSLRWRLAIGETGIAFFLIAMLLRRGVHGVRLFLPFFAFVLAVISALWIAPDIALLERSMATLPDAERSARAGRILHLRLVLGGIDAVSVLTLFFLLTLENRRSGGAR